MVVVVVDSEAEFDWTAGAPRRAMGVTSVKAQLKVQSIFERYEVRPTYVLDYPVSSTPEAYEIIRELHQSGTCEIGAHLGAALPADSRARSSSLAREFRAMKAAPADV